MPYQKIGKIIKNATPNKELLQLNDKQIQGLKSVSEIALAVIASVGIGTISLIAPNLLWAIGRFFKKSKKRLSHQEKQTKVAQAFYYLKRHNYIKIEPEGDDCKISMTERGKKELSQLNMNLLEIPKSKSWDGKWWQVAADIPTKEHRQGADLLRKKLKEMKFFPLQRSLWFYPFDPRREVEFIINFYGIAQFVTVMEINRLDIDDELKLKDFFRSSGIL